jgi:Uma2 family endonuclease
MAVQLSKRLFTLDEFERMVEAGILTENDRVELVEGEIVEMAPKGSRHASCVTRMNALFIRHLGQSAVVRIQDPVRVGGRSELEPDVALVRPRDDLYANSHPDSNDVLLLAEVSDTTLAYDRGVKLALYAKAGIREVWIVNLPDEVIEVYALPSGGIYQQTRVASRGEIIELQTLPGFAFAVNDILGPVPYLPGG